MRTVTFYLGPTTGLTSRQLTITRRMRAGDDSAPAAQHDADAGAVETVSVDLPNNTLWQAKLVDTRTSGEEADPQILNFHTGELQFPGPAATNTDSLFRILSMEDLSSSQSSSSSSVSSSSVSSQSSVSSSSSESSSSSSSSSVSSSSTGSSSSASSYGSSQSSSSSSSQSASSVSSSSVSSQSSVSSSSVSSSSSASSASSSSASSQT